MTAPRKLDWLAAVPCAVVGGLCLDGATPGLDWWPLAFVAGILILAALWQQRAGFGALLGALAGSAFWLPHISWLTLYLGPIPWLALSAVMIAWFALLGLAVAVATRGISRLRMRPWAKVAVQSLAVAGLWVAREQLQGAWPYGGFAWGRLAHTQADGPLATLVSWMGFSGLSALIALACAIPVAVAFTVQRSGVGVGVRGGAGGAIGRILPAGVACVSVAAALAFLTLVPVAPTTSAGTLTVAAVQGNSKSGIFDDRENGDVFRAHLETTEAMLEQLSDEGRSVDLIVWPENSAEFDLPGQPQRLYAIQRIAREAQAPVVVGTILKDPDGRYTNSTLVIDAEGETGLRYDKRRPVPFAEYMPNREFFHALVPDLVDLVQLDYRAGTLPSVLDIPLHTGGVAAGIAICFDIIFDDHAVSMSQHGAQIILAQTNNADFGRTDESAQQLQIARLRAVESGRTLVNISTVGTSAIVLPEGSDAARLATFTADAMVAEVPAVDGETPALRFGAAIAAVWVALGALGIIGGATALVRDRAKDRRS